MGNLNQTFEEKLDLLLDTAVVVRQELRDRTRKLVKGLIIVGVFFTIVLGAAAGALYSLHKQATDLQSIAEQNHVNGEVTRSTAEAIQAATSPEAAAKANAATAVAVAEIRRSIDCVAFYMNGERPPACTDIAARMDAIRAGEDPFHG